MVMSQKLRMHKEKTQGLFRGQGKEGRNVSTGMVFLEYFICRAVWAC